MTIKFYSYWTPIAKVDGQASRKWNNQETQDLANELNTVLGNQKLVSMTSAAVNGIVVTTIAYEEQEV
jgi:hypothetical protein